MIEWNEYQLAKSALKVRFQQQEEKFLDDTVIFSRMWLRKGHLSRIFCSTEAIFCACVPWQSEKLKYILAKKEKEW